MEIGFSNYFFCILMVFNTPYSGSPCVVPSWDWLNTVPLLSGSPYGARERAACHAICRRLSSPSNTCRMIAVEMMLKALIEL